MMMEAAPDGQRFLMKVVIEGADASLTTVLNWPALLPPTAQRQ
jgi:hypothetical protein